MEKVYLTKREKRLIVNLFLFVMLSLYMNGYLFPQVNSIYRYKKEISLKEKKILELSLKEKEIKKIENQIQLLKYENHEFDFKVPLDFRIPELILQMDEAIKKSNFILKDISYGKELNSNGYFIVPIYLKLKGNYNDLNNLLDTIKSSKRLFSVKYIKISDKESIVKESIGTMLEENKGRNNFEKEFYIELNVYSQTNMSFKNLNLNLIKKMNIENTKQKSKEQENNKSKNVNNEDKKEYKEEIEKSIEEEIKEIKKEIKEMKEVREVKETKETKETQQNIKKDLSEEEKKTITVLKGDTVYSLSKKYSISIEELRNINNLKDNKIEIGQKLIISKE